MGWAKGSKAETSSPTYHPHTAARDPLLPFTTAQTPSSSSLHPQRTQTPDHSLQGHQLPKLLWPRSPPDSSLTRLSSRPRPLHLPGTLSLVPLISQVSGPGAPGLTSPAIPLKVKSAQALVYPALPPRARPVSLGPRRALLTESTLLGLGVSMCPAHAPSQELPPCRQGHTLYLS